jgi:hypothetical protein
MIPSEIDIHPTAINEARQAYRWYLRRSAAAASRFQRPEKTGKGVGSRSRKTKVVFLNEPD